MQKIRMKWFDKKDHLAKKDISQIYSQGLEFAVATATEQCSHFVYCKDFLHDAVWAKLYNTPVEVHNFKYDPIKYPIDIFDMTRVLVGNGSDEFFHKRIPNCIDFLNQVEKVLRLKRTVAYECESPPEDYLPGGVFLLEGSQRWMSAPPLLSMYTMFIRCGFVHEIGTDYMGTLEKIACGKVKPYQDNDKDFVDAALPGIRAIMTLGYRKIFFKDMKKNYPAKIAVMTLHHDCGIRAYSWGKTKETVGHWHRQKLLDALKERGVEIQHLWTIPPPPPLPPSPQISDDSLFIHKKWGPKAGVAVSKGVKTEMKDMNEKIEIPQEPIFIGEDKETEEAIANAATPYKKSNWNW